MKRGLVKAIFLSIFFSPFVASAHLIQINSTSPFPSSALSSSTLNATYTVVNISPIRLSGIQDQSLLPSGMTLLNSSTCGASNPLASGESCSLNLQLHSPAAATTLTGSLRERAVPSLDGVQIPIKIDIVDRPGVTTLSASLSNLALATSGNARTITITNTGATSAENLSISYPTWPSGTSASSTCGSTLNAGETCTITVTPGSHATSSCNTPSYIAPTPGVITVNASNVTSSPTTNVVVLTYGCIYQQGYLFAIDDSTPNNTSIGGTIVSLVDQSSGVFWSYNGNSGSPDSSQDAIPGTDEISTSSVGSPTYAASQIAFNNTYHNTSTYPFPSSSDFSTCDGATDGACNSRNILELYNTYITNYGVTNLLAPGPTDLADYAAGVCSQYTIDSSGNSPCSAGTCYNNWYLPAICQMGASGEGAGCSAGVQNMVTNLPGLLVGCSGASCLSGGYWGSTEYSGPSAPYRAWYQNFDPNFQDRDDKATSYIIRCSRALSP